jgi:para-aminobenzoate synthetase component 1
VSVRLVAWPKDPECLFAALARRRGCVWLDSAGGPADLARWSVLAAEPSVVLTSEGSTRLLDPAGKRLFETREDPFDVLRETLAAVRLDGGEAEARWPYGPGFYGYLSYDLAPHVESRAGLSARRDIPLPDAWFGLYEAVLVLDHLRREAALVGQPGPAWAALEEALKSAAGGARDEPETPAGGPPPVGVTCNFRREEYLRAIDRARQYIAAGDIYQVNLSRRFTVRLAPAAAGRPPVDLYLALRRANPAPYAAYLDLGGGQAVLSSSPELFLSLQAGRVVTRPIKGTRPLRPGDAAFNARQQADLLASEKDRAELVMIVDLERNDLGRVCSYGTVRVTQERVLEAYAAVYHTTAAVEGRLHEGRDLVDLLNASFPGGSITGAPKVRAMQIIAELEPTRRSVYTGAVGYLAPPTRADPAGRCVLNIAIRTLLVAGPSVHLQVGGGIVADSDPEAEFQETCDKARAMFQALDLASE